MDYLLTDKDVMKIIGGTKASKKLVPYTDLMGYNSIEQAFGVANKIVLLYVNESDATSMTGHWCLLTAKRNGENQCTIEFQDPYGKFPDDHFEDFTPEMLSRTGQKSNHLVKLLHAFMTADPANHFVDYNELPLQKNSRSINTCGRHTALRGRFFEIPLKQYQKIWKDASSRKGMDIDALATKLTDNLMGR